MSKICKFRSLAKAANLYLVMLLLMLIMTPVLLYAQEPKTSVVIGKIQAISHHNKTITVKGVKLIVDRNSVIQDKRGMPVNFSELRVGHAIESAYLFGGSGVDAHAIYRISLLSKYSNYEIPKL